MTDAPILPGCTVLPPMEPARPRTTSTNGKAKTPKRKDKSATRNRFAVLNAFADFTLRTIDRAGIAVWLVLWRDTKADGLAKTSQSDLA